MKPRDIALAVVVMAVWGFNFVVIRVGLDHLPPLLFSALRFAAVAPLALFLGGPRAPWRWVIAVGLALGVVKFSLLFAGMAAGMPAGLSALVLQCQAVFTAVLAVVLLGERMGLRQVAGLTVAAAGIAVVGLRLGPDRPAAAFALVIAAGAAWGVANVAMRRAAAPDVLRFIVWVSVVATPVLFVLSLAVDGPATVATALGALDLTAIGAIAYIAFAATVFGFGVWGLLIRRYGAAPVAPFTMLAPIFAIASGALVLGEPVHGTDLIGGTAVILGVLLGALPHRLSRRFHPRPAPEAAPELEPEPAASAEVPAAPRSSTAAGAGSR